MWNIDRIREMWPAAMMYLEPKYTQEKPAAPAPLFERNSCRRWRKSIVEEALGLGMIPRLVVAVEVYAEGEHKKDLLKNDPAKAFNTYINDFRSTLTDSHLAKGFFELGSDDATPGVKQIEQAPEEKKEGLIKKRRRSLDRYLKKLDEQANNTETIFFVCRALAENYEAIKPLVRDHASAVSFFRQNFSSRDAVDQFAHYLKTGDIRPASRNDLVDKAPLFEDPDGNRVAYISRLVADVKEAEPGKLIHAVQMRGAHQGLKAAAQRIYDLLGKACPDRPVLLIPCVRSMSRDPFLGMDYFVNTILYWLDNKPPVTTPTTEAAVSHMSQEEIASKLALIRKRLAQIPCILVFCGLEVRRGPLETLRQVIADNPVLDVLAHLIYPPLSIKDPTNAEVFRRTRFIVLADGQLNVLSAHTKNYGVFPGPPKDRLGDISIRFVAYRGENGEGEKPDPHRAFRAEEWAKQWFSNHKGAPSEELQAAHESVVDLLGISAYNSIPQSEKEVFQQLVQAVTAKTSPGLDLLMLRVLACSETGVTFSNLWWIAKTWAAITAEHVTQKNAKHMKVVRAEPTSWGEACETFVRKYWRLVTIGPNEAHAVLNSTSHRYQAYGYPRTSTGALAETQLDERHKLKTLRFIHPGIAQAFVDHLKLEPARWPYPTINRLACNCVLGQQIILSRHGGAETQYGALRSHRKALEALLYGFRALPAARDIRACKTWPRMPVYGVFPRKPLGAFRFLYGVLHNHVIEAGAAHRVSRQWGADALKTDLACLAHCAFREYDYEPSFLDRPVWEMDRRLKGLRSFFQEHYTAAAIGTYRSYDLDRWNQLAPLVHKHLELKGGDKGVPVLLHRVVFDLEALQYGPLGRPGQSLIDLCLSQLKKTGFKTSPTRPEQWVNVAIDGPRIKLVGEESIKGYFESWRTSDYPKAPKNKGRAADWLGRLAELHYQQAVLSSDEAPTTQTWSHWMDSLVCATGAAQLRRMAFADDSSYSNIPWLHSKGARTLVRAALDAIEYLRGYESPNVETSQVADTVVYLADTCRQTLDWYALNYANNPPDRVLMLLLEARYVRVAGGLSDDGFYIVESQKARERTRIRFRTALDFVSEAESTLLTVQYRPVLRMRVLGERCATLCRFAEFESIAGAPSAKLREAALLAGLAVHDATQLQQLVTETFGRLDDSRGDRGGESYGSVWRKQAKSALRKSQQINKGVAALVRNR